MFIESDKERITQVISNILDNAIKFAKAKLEEGRVETINIDAQRNDDNAIVSIVDTGSGIDPVCDKIFDWYRFRIVHIKKYCRGSWRQIVGSEQS